MANNANQHYVPQFYFRYFSKDGKSICVLNRNNGRAYQSAPIKGQASKNYFYGDAVIEHILSEMEKLFSAALRRIKTDLCFEKCTQENYELLLQNIIFQYYRSMKARQSNKPMYDKMTQLIVECMANDNDNLLSKDVKTYLLNNRQNIVADEKTFHRLQIVTAIKQRV